MGILLIIGAFQAFFMGALLFSKKGRAVNDSILTALFLVYGLTMILAYLEVYNRSNNFPLPMLIHTSVPLILLHGPLLWLYVRSLTGQNYTFKKLYLLHFLPFLLVFSRLFFSVYILPAEQKILNETSEVFRTDIMFPVTIGLIALSTQGYNIWGLFMLRDYRKGIKSWFSRVEHIDHHWLQFLLVSAVIFYALISLLYILDYALGLMSYDALQIMGYSFATLFILVLGFYGYRKGNLFASPGIAIDLQQAAMQQPNNAALEEGEQLFVQKLLDTMREKKTYLDPDLTLGLLARDLKVSPDYLSAILNGRLNRNFFDFINHYRVEEFKVRCRMPAYANQKLLALAWDCGFNSKATFNRVFKKATGLTPGQFQRQVAVK